MDDRFKEMVNIWFHVSGKVDLLQFYEAERTRIEEGYQAQETREYEVWLHEQASLQQLEMPTFRHIHPNEPLDQQKLHLQTAKQELIEWDINTRLGFERDFPGVSYTPEDIQRTLAPWKSAAAHARLELELYHARLREQAGPSSEAWRAVPYPNDQDPLAEREFNQKEQTMDETSGERLLERGFRNAKETAYEDLYKEDASPKEPPQERQYEHER